MEIILLHDNHVDKYSTGRRQNPVHIRELQALRLSSDSLLSSDVFVCLSTLSFKCGQDPGTGSSGCVIRNCSKRHAQNNNNKDITRTTHGNETWRPLKAVMLHQVGPLC